MNGFKAHLAKIHGTVPLHAVAGIGLSGLSLGLAYRSYKNNQKSVEALNRQTALEHKSFKALEKIHLALQQNPNRAL
jgi:hypothetical protein